jgi:signal peptidase I
VTEIAVGAAVAAVAVLVFVAVRRRYVAVTVLGPSMEPALHHGDLVVVRRTRIEQVRRGQVVVFEHPPPWRSIDGWADGRLLPESGFYPAAEAPRAPRWTIKRVAAVPGDALPMALADHAAQLGAVVPAGSLAVLGDNAGRSVDSRNFGYVRADQVLGVTKS